MLRALSVILEFSFVHSLVFKGATISKRRQYSNIPGFQNDILQYDSVNVTDIWWPSWTSTSTTVFTVLKNHPNNNFKARMDNANGAMNLYTDVGYLLNRNREGITSTNVTSTKDNVTRVSVTVGLIREAGNETPLTATPDPGTGQGGTGSETPSVPEQPTEWTTETTASTTEATSPLFKEDEWTTPVSHIGPTMSSTVFTLVTEHTTLDPFTDIKVGDVLEGHVILTSTTKNPLAVELNKMIETSHVGMYTVFMIKMLELIIHKDDESIRHLLFSAQAFTGSLNMNVVGSGRDLEFMKVMDEVASKFSTFEPDYVRDIAILAIKMLEVRKKEMAVDTNSIFNMLDDLYNEDEAPSMLAALIELQGYPHNNKTANSVVSAIMDIVYRKPSSKTLESIKYKVLVDAIKKAYNIRFNPTYVEPEGRYDDPTTRFDRASDITAFTKLYSGNGVEVNATGDFLIDRNDVRKTRFKDLFKSQRLKNRIGVIKYSDYINKVKPHGYFKNGSKAIAGYHNIRHVRELEDGNYNDENKSEYAKRLLKKKMQHHKGSNYAKQMKIKTKKIRKKVIKQLGNVENNKKERRPSTFDDDTQLKTIRKGQLNHKNKHYFQGSRQSKRKQESLYFNKGAKNYATKQHSKINENKVTLRPSNRKIKNSMLLKKITQLSSVSDEEEILKTKLLNAMKMQDGRKSVHEIKKNIYDIFSSYSDEDIQLKINIYKAFGIDNEFNNVKT